MTNTMTDNQLSLLTIREGQVAFDEDQKKAVVDVLRVRHASDADLAVFFHMAVRTRLDPFRRQLYMIARQEWNSETNSKEWRQTFQTGIDGFRVNAERDATRRGVQLKKARFQYWDAEGNVTDAWWKPEPPAMVRATVQLGDDEPVIWDARYDEYVPLKDEYEDVLDEQGRPVRVNNKKQTRKTGKKVPQGMWATRPTAQLEKCAEAGALRRACPEDLSNLYVDAEMQRHDAETATTVLVDDGAPAKGKRDWVAEAKVAKDQEALREIWRSSAAAGEKSPAVMAAVRARTAEIREAQTETSATDGPGDDSVAEGSSSGEPESSPEEEPATPGPEALDEARAPAKLHAPDDWDSPENGTVCGLPDEEGELDLVEGRSRVDEVTCPSCRAALGLDEEDQ